MKKILLILSILPFLASSCPTCYGQKLIENNETAKLFVELSKNFDVV